MFVLLPIAFISGILTVFSPCVLPILPIVLASGVDGDTRRIKGVITGLVTSFTLASLLLATVVKVVGVSADVVRSMAVGLLVLLGIMLVFPVIWQRIQVWVEKHWRFTAPRNKGKGFLGGFITGVALGVVWTPCVGPIVAAVATLAAVGSFSTSAVLISLVYALGIGFPLYVIAKKGGKVFGRLNIVKSRNQNIRQVFGVVILVTALFIWMGLDRNLQAWTLNNLPESWTQLPTTFERRFNVDLKLNRLRGEDMRKVSPGETIVREVSLQSDFSGAKVKKDDLVQGCPRKDCIPSIDSPSFDTASEAGKWLNDDDVVFAIDYHGSVRAYPQRIINWHEIINDEVDGTPIAITFCPLCGSAVAFERKVNGVITELGVSGKLHSSDLVMYDRYEGNLWQQITGEAIVGPAARRDEKLSKIPIITVGWGQWKNEHPDTQVLSRDTGYNRDYNRYPYGTYEKDDQLLFGVKGLDKSLQIKTVVYGIEINGASKAYPEDIFNKNASIQDILGDTRINLEKKSSGEILVTNIKTGEKVVPTRVFWFAWAAFHPNTDLYSSQ